MIAKLALVADGKLIEWGESISMTSLPESADRYHVAEYWLPENSRTICVRHDIRMGEVIVALCWGFELGEWRPEDLVREWPVGCTLPEALAERAYQKLMEKLPDDIWEEFFPNGLNYIGLLKLKEAIQGLIEEMQAQEICSLDIRSLDVQGQIIVSGPDIFAQARRDR